MDELPSCFVEVMKRRSVMEVNKVELQSRADASVAFSLLLL